MKKTFEIYLIKKIPYLTNGLLILLCTSLLLFSFTTEFVSTNRFTAEMVSFFLITTSSIKFLYGWVFSTALLLYLYTIARQRRKGVVVFHSDSFEILLSNSKQTILFDNIRRVYCNDSENKNGEPNNEFTLTIETWKNKKILLRIRNTTDINSFTDKLFTCDQLKIEHFSLTTLD
jgi:hypothetical protein